ncbi:MAG: HDOD domain-containing protein [Deltaproteobacteria bacterium]|jgi:putative nucleotidyltransferase with HDIG domain|nr:HDOD domain-containing protein [Deltaproteobacteria bacterium]
MKNSILGKILLNVESFPSLPRAGSRLLSIIDRPETTVAEIEKVLRYDPGLTVNFLKLANSPFFGLRTKISSVKQAITLLGINRLKEIVLATCTGVIMDKEVLGWDLRPLNLWQHSIIVSSVAAGLANYKKLSDAEDLFTSALLHDIGKLALGKFVKEHLNVIKDIISKGVPGIVAENMVLETDHAEIGAQILTQWSFPPDVVEAVRHHHNPDILHNKNIKIDLLHLADIFSHMNNETDGDETNLDSLSPALRMRIGIEKDKLELFANQISIWAKDFSSKLAF